MLLSLRVLIVFFLLFFIFPLQTFAAIELTFSTPPAELDVNQSFSLDITLSGATEGSEYYVRGSFFHNDTPTNYFGFTKNNSGNWNNKSGEFSNFYKIIGNGTTTIDFKPDLSVSEYKGPGSYQFKIGRYTTGGSLTWSNQSPAVIQLTSTSSPTPISTSTSQPEPQIELSEVMACPASGESEWVELKNTSSFTAELTDWFIKDSTESYQKKFTVSIPSNGYTTIDVSNLNNDGDTVRLFNQASSQVASMSYSECLSGLSWMNNDGSWNQTTSVTKNASNTLTAPTTPPSTSTPTPKPTATPKSNPTPKPSDSASPTSSKNPSTTSPTRTASNQQATLAALPLIGESGEILGESTEDIPFPSSYATESASVKNDSSDKRSAIVAIVIGGTLFLGIGGYFLREWYNKQIHG